MNLYGFARSACSMVFRPYYRVQVIGRENIPNEEGLLLCSNHISNLDPVILGVTFPRPVHFMAKEELFSVPVLGKIVPKLNAFPVKRGMSDKQALRKGLGVLKEQEVLGIFPEGTRSKTGSLGEGLSGVGFFALRSNARVLPAAVIGPYKPFGKLKVVYGKPIDFDTMRAEKVSAREATSAIMEAIEDLISNHK
ncbi:lysophospholipid acyltransferase family protein [Bacillus marinisedimentorum]|uniref:lysophospholipid acyltransferase family protein n=1 Tax=Bacillus marinisedimentorum TaxID=1821260 RepID=UPI0008734BB6|nr:lysophospholipid acyltransferase family protein [Bacillus marinisedimentorum]